ncbi:MAG: ferritin [Methanoregulaceae archaeon]
MLKKSMESALNRQINRELYSAYLYLSMSACLESLSLKGFAHWLMVQAHEEQTHAMKMYDYLIDKGAVITLSAIDAPRTKWTNPREVFEDVLAHEQKVTGFINELVDLALRENDHASNNFLQWFVAEQVEEEKNAGDILGKIRMTADVPGNLFILDQELGKRQ